MPRYTNKHNAPDALFRLLGKEKYSRGDSVKSVSQLINPPRIDILKREYDEHVEVDISERIWALFGTAVHALIEEGTPHSDNEIVEERIYAEVGGWKISGAVDRQVLTNGNLKLIDWKVTRVWSVLGEVKKEWILQLNCYAELIEMTTDKAVEGLEVGALLRDWSKAEYDRQTVLGKWYPPSPIHTVKVPLWPREKRTAYLAERVELHQAAEVDFALGEKLRPCTPDEMWTTPSKWKVFKRGGLRASKVFDSKEEADEYSEGCNRASKAGVFYDVIESPGRRIRCEFCEVSRFCDQYKDYQRQQG